MSQVPSRFWSRRQILGMGLAVSATGLIGGWELAWPSAVEAQSTMTPDAALAALMEGNKRFTSGQMTKQDLGGQRSKTAEKQEPFAAVISCADSRVPVEMVFDLGIGQLFVTRVAGNVITPEIIGSLEYGAAVLGTKAILVLGHSGCGAVKATIDGKEVPGQISSLFPHIQPAVDQAGHDLVAATKANAKNQAALLRQSSTVISSMAKAGTVKVAAAYYDLASGTVTMVD